MHKFNYYEINVLKQGNYNNAKFNGIQVKNQEIKTGNFLQS